eukprot:CAMPEP_0179098990 /NCGR_PEP_ID=MMETSP0796-20121207/45646_1 /TAXON_ID=73915 /ORGANISM="Pyrodinium bahamense, Strain pbaha01" /LENGTH=235 /DNA_ID=CAMNT_0020796781 /DNA_START=46 /DNA_END=753 /DNA_ORIENTATION=-
MACCCVTNGEVVEPWDLPMEPEHATPSRMSQLTHPVATPGQESEESAAHAGSALKDHLKVGAVALQAGASQGLELLHSASENLVIICGVVMGPWSKWNEAHPDHMVQPCDEILEVNSKRGDYSTIISEMTLKTTRSRMLTMSIRRATEHRILVHKDEGETLGLGLVPLENGLLFIDAVNRGGVIDRWNARNPDQKVRVLDRIVEVNHIRGNAVELVDALKQDGNIEIMLQTHPES